MLRVFSPKCYKSFKDYKVYTDFYFLLPLHKKQFYKQLTNFCCSLFILYVNAVYLIVKNTENGLKKCINWVKKTSISVLTKLFYFFLIKLDYLLKINNRAIRAGMTSQTWLIFLIKRVLKRIKNTVMLRIKFLIFTLKTKYFCSGGLIFKRCPKGLKNCRKLNFVIKFVKGNLYL